MDIIHVVGCVDIHDYDDDTDYDPDDDPDDDTSDNTNDDTDDVGAGTCILSKFSAAVPGSLVLVVLGPWSWKYFWLEILEWLPEK